MSVGDGAAAGEGGEGPRKKGGIENAYRAVQSNMERIAGAAREDIDIFGRGARIRRRRGGG